MIFQDWHITAQMANVDLMMANSLLINSGILNLLPILNSLVIFSLLTMIVQIPKLLLMVVGLAVMMQNITMTNYGNLYLCQREMITIVMIYQDMKL